MTLEITGKLLQVLPEQTGTGKSGTNWAKQDFIIETPHEQYPKKICFSAWGDKMQVLKTLNPGMQLNVAFDVESREHQGKWYTNLKAWKIVAAGNATSGAEYNQEPVESSQPYNDLNAVADGGSKDDLPF
ncbi:MAG: DUF3127 domain-containing protein [Bacteroidia bacterium]